MAIKSLPRCQYSLPKLFLFQFLGRWYEIARFFASFEGIAGTCWVENYKFKHGRGHFTVLEWKDHL